MLKQMFFKLFEFLAVQMNKLAAALTLIMEANFARMCFFAYILKSGGAVVIYRVFIDAALIDHFFKVTVNGGCAYGLALRLKMLRKR